MIRLTRYKFINITYLKIKDFFNYKYYISLKKIE